MDASIEADDIILKLDKISERRIRDAIEAGEFDDLEGAGEPLKFEDNPFVPQDMRAAFKVLSNSGHSPDWMLLSQEIETDIERLRQAADRHFAYLRKSLQEIAGDTYAVKRLRSGLERLAAEHRRASAQHSRLIEDINSKINSFNQQVPIASLLKVPLSHSAEMERYEDRVPAYLRYVRES